MTPPSEPARRYLDRFSRAERAVHWITATLMIICILTAAVLYNGSLSIKVGHRHVVELIHVYGGFALPAPMLFGLASAAYRADLATLNRFSPSDWRWLRSRTRRDGSIRVGKFNAGQKLNAALTAGAILVLLGSGLLMYDPGLARLSWRTGATVVHDWFALAVGVLIVGHITYAIKDREARHGMRTGGVSASWAHAEHAAWAEDIDQRPDQDDNSP
ncbi:MAG: cytochrome b/b6 domain-containing protein [Jatrophihabitantaceae bacterium]